MALDAAQNALISTIQGYVRSEAITTEEADVLITQVESGDLQGASERLNTLIGSKKTLLSRTQQAFHAGDVGQVAAITPINRGAENRLHNHLVNLDDAALSRGEVPDTRSVSLVDPFLVG